MLAQQMVKAETAEAAPAEIRMYVTRTPLFAEGKMTSHVATKIVQDPFTLGISITTQCRRTFAYDIFGGFDMKIRRYIVEYKLGASNRKVHLHYDAYAFSLLANRCLRCGFNSPEEKVHTQLGTKSVAVSTTVTCVAGSELEQFILSLPHGADRMF